MNTPVTVLAPIKLAKGRTEAELLAASERFQQEFVVKEDGVLRRELVRQNAGEYLDIVQFRSLEDARQIIEKEMKSPVCLEFFSIMDMSEEDSSDIQFFPSLATYGS